MSDKITQIKNKKVKNIGELFVYSKLINWPPSSKALSRVLTFLLFNLGLPALI
jgi:hypothetical protein